ncbi:MAG: penicillin-binding protein 2 [Dokdonella sp.]
MKKRLRPVNLRARLYLVVMMLALASTALVVRAVDLQVVRKDFYQGQGDARFLRDIPIPVSRGTIFDRNGEPLAVSTPVEAIWINPKELLQYRDQIPVLAKALDMDADDVVQRIEQRADKEFLYLKRPVDPDFAKDVLALKIPGVASERAFRRYYPSGEVLGHELGLTNIDDRGQEGLELAFDEWLAGKPGVKRVIQDMRKQVVENVEQLRDEQPGHDLTLSIDRRIQYVAYRELKSAVIANRAASGSMVILDVSNGEILAMVNQPSFNPNSRSSIDPQYRRNRAAINMLEPGSTMKPFTIAAALESGKWKPNTPVDTTPGTFLVGGHTVRDVHNKGLIDVTRVITYSSNVGAAKIALTLPNELMYDVFHRFGFGEVTGSGFPGESPGFLPAAKTWGVLEKATLAYGYGLNVTPLQLAQAYSALANDGRLRSPTFVKGERNPETQVIDPQLAATIRGMLETVVSPQGSGLKAAIPNYRVGGKTGTSRRAIAGGYESRYVSLFAGMVPMSAPRLVGVVVIHDPGGGHGGVYYGGLVSGPVFSKVMAEALRLLDVPPDNVQHWYTGAPDSGQTIDTSSPAPDYAPDQTNYEEGDPQ